MRYEPTDNAWSSARALQHKLVMAAELWGGCRRVAAEHRIPTVAVLQRYRVIRRAISASPREFFRYQLWDTSRSLAERLEFLTWARRRPLEPYLNPKSAAEYAQSKLRSDEIFVANAIAVPRCIGVWQPHDDPAALEAMIRPLPHGVVMKPEHGVSGKGVLVFTAYEPGRLRHASGDWWSMSKVVAELAQGTDPVVVQERVVAHPDIAALAGTPFAASLRLVTCLRDDGSVLILPATLKLPSPTTGIDNFGAGNVAIAIDEAGIMGPAAHGLDGPQIDRHPTTGLAFAGRAVPFFDEAITMVRSGQRCLPQLRSIGWDVAITPDGPRMLEANIWWGIDVVQQPGFRGLLRGEFLEFLEEIGAEDVIRRPARGLPPSRITSPHRGPPG